MQERERRRILVSWSGGKDAAWALHALRAAGDRDPVGLVTALVPELGRTAMHGVRTELVRAQTRAAGLRCSRCPCPSPAPTTATRRPFSPGSPAPAGLVPGDVVEREGFIYADFLPAVAAHA